MAKEKEGKNKVTLLSYDPVETAEEIISSDKDIDRKTAFRDAYKKVMNIIPEYFIKQKKKRKNGSTDSTGGTSFTQSIIVTPENVKVETNEIDEHQVEEEKEREE